MTSTNNHVTIDPIGFDEQLGQSTFEITRISDNRVIFTGTNTECNNYVFRNRLEVIDD